MDLLAASRLATQRPRGSVGGLTPARFGHTAQVTARWGPLLGPRRTSVGFFSAEFRRMPCSITMPAHCPGLSHGRILPSIAKETVDGVGSIAVRGIDIVHQRLEIGHGPAHSSPPARCRPTPLFRHSDRQLGIQRKATKVPCFDRSGNKPLLAAGFVIHD